MTDRQRFSGQVGKSAIVLALLATPLLLSIAARSAHGQNVVPSVAGPNAQSRPVMPKGYAAVAPPGVLDSTDAAIDQEQRGQFPTMERGPTLPLGTLQRGWDRPVPASGQTAPGIIHYIWQADFIMGVRTRDFMVTTLVLPRWEHVNEYYLGDSVVFEVKKIRDNVIAVRSRNAGADSNLTVLGASGNIYNFYVRSETWNSSQISDITVYVDAPRPNEEGERLVSWGAGDTGVDFAAQPSTVESLPDYLRRIVVRPEDIRFDVKMFAAQKSDADIAPERVFEDGVFTYFDFGDRSDAIERPVVHQVVDGVDAVVNTRTAGPRGNVLIAEAVGDFTLRNGRRVVCVRMTAKRPPPAAVVIGQDMPSANGMIGDGMKGREGGR